MKISEKEKQILEYCYKYWEKMWAVTIMSIILDCDFRDAPWLYKELKDAGELND